MFPTSELGAFIANINAVCPPCCPLSRLAEELVSSTQKSEKASEALAAVVSLKKEVELSQQRSVILCQGDLAS